MSDRLLFIPENLDEFRNHPTIQEALTGFQLLTYDELTEWIVNDMATSRSGPSSRPSRSGPSSRPSRSNPILKIQSLLEEIVSSVCEGNIEKQYGNDAIQNFMENPEIFDILVAVDANAYMQKIPFNSEHIKGFVIAELGECKAKPDVYSINLICTRSVPIAKKGKKAVVPAIIAPKFKGMLLLGAFMFALKKRGHEMGILELASGYRNSGGFFAYSKMGFNADIDNTLQLYQKQDPTCFTDLRNLPMSVDLTKFKLLPDDSTPETKSIVGLATGTEKLTREEIHDSTGFIDLVPKSPVQKTIQSKLGVINNLIYQNGHENVMELYTAYTAYADEQKQASMSRTRATTRSQARSPSMSPENPFQLLEFQEDLYIHEHIMTKLPIGSTQEAIDAFLKNEQAKLIADFKYNFITQRRKEKKEKEERREMRKTVVKKKTQIPGIGRYSQRLRSNAMSVGQGGNRKTRKRS